MKVLLALDHSRAACDAARAAVDLLGEAQAEFLVVNVTEVPITWAGAGYGFGAVVSLQLGALQAEAGVEQAEVAADDARAAGVPDPEVETVTGDVAHEICAAAQRHQVDLIVVGSHDRTLLSRLFEPSVSRAVLRSSNRPVLVVPESSG